MTVAAVTPLDRAGVRPSSRRTARTAGRRARAPAEPYYGVIARRQSWTAATAMPSPEHTLRGAAALLRRNSWALRGGCSSRFGTAPCSLPLKSVAATCSPGGLQVAERSGLRDIATTDIYESIVAAVPAGEWGDYGRLWAWRSMAGLSDAPAGVSAEEVERQVRQSTWFRLEAYADWFHNDIDADYGIAALSPDCRRIAVPAATDTDWTPAGRSHERRLVRVPQGEWWGRTARESRQAGAGPNEGGALRRPEEDPSAPGGSVHVPGISTRAWPVPVPVPVPVRLRRTR